MKNQHIGLRSGTLWAPPGYDAQYLVRLVSIEEKSRTCFKSRSPMMLYDWENQVGRHRGADASQAYQRITLAVHYGSLGV